MIPSLTILLGVPPGVINIVHGTGPKTGEAILKNPDVSLLSFTGSTAVGQRVLESSAKCLRKVSLEVNEIYIQLLFKISPSDNIK